MAVVVVMDQKGNTQELLKKYDIVNQHLMSAGAPPKGLIAHFCMETPDGMRVSNVFESKADAEAGMKNPLLLEGFAKGGMTPVEPQVLPVHNHFIVSEMKSRV